MYRVEARRLSRPQALSLIFLVFLFTSITNNIHRFYVDHSSVSAEISNLAWQLDVHRLVMQLSPAVAHHSYRFLPNSIVRWMELSHVSYEPARDIYRLIFGLLLYYAIYRYARLFTDYAGAMLALVLTAVIYPISFEYYAGQLTDPLSHLCFVLAFIFLEIEDFALLLTTLLIGSLAKETVLAMAGYYVLFNRKELNHLAKAATLCISSFAMYLGVRLFVLHGAIHYRQISGVTAEHIWTNWLGGRRLPIFCLTVGGSLPFLIAGWKQTPISLRRQVFFLLPVLFIPSTLFGWLFEARNFMPLVFVLAVIAGNYLGGFSLEDPLLPLQTAESSNVRH